MIKKAVLLVLIPIMLISFISCNKTKPFNLEDALRNLPGVKIREIASNPPFKKSYEISLPQPIDHNKPAGETFIQRLQLSHLDPSKPMVLVTEGYSMGHNYIEELSHLLVANQLRVEHRYFGQSKPVKMDEKWQYLNLKQATADYHRIVRLFKNLYSGKWVSTGWSKGGQTALTYRSYYPDDVSATVAYDAPLNFALEDPRIDRFFENVGTPECRERLKKFQRLVLKNKQTILPMFKEYVDKKGYTYSIGQEKALEYIVLEYPFSFWQYEKLDCSTIPGDDNTPRVMFDHLKKVVSFSSYADRSLNSPAMYQFCTQFGYYGYVKDHLADLLSSQDYANCAYAPQGIALEYDPSVMLELNEWLKKYGNNILYIYGQKDPWSAPAVQLSEKTNAIKMILREGNHFTFINTFPNSQKNQMKAVLNDWLN